LKFVEVINCEFLRNLNFWLRKIKVREGDDFLGETLRNKLRICRQENSGLNGKKVT